MDTGTRHPARTINPRPAQAPLEPLEARRHLSAAPWIVNGTGGADVIRVAQNGGTVSVTRNGATTSRTGVSSVTVNGGGGNDSILASESVRVALVLNGGDGDDQLRGGAGPDQLRGGAGADTLYGGSGDDVLVSLGGDRDTVTGAAGNDSLWTDWGATDRITDLGSGDTQHEVRQFMSYRIERNGRVTTADVPLRPAGQRLADPVAAAAVARWKNFSDHPLFPPGGAAVADVDQNAAADCYFLATAASIADVAPERLADRVVDLGDGTYAVDFESYGKHTFVRVDADLPIGASGNLFYAGLGREGSIWAPILEKAWAFYRRNEGTYASIEYGRSKDVFRALGVTDVQFGEDANAFRNSGGLLEAMDDLLGTGRAVTYWTKGATAAGSWLRPRHVLMVVDVVRDRSGKATAVVFRDPYKVDGVTAADGSNDGFITVPAAKVIASMRGLTWCRP